MPSDLKFLSGIAAQCTDTLANWELYNPVIPEGVLCIEKSGVGEFKLKIGDGIKTYTQLGYFAGDAEIELATALIDGLLSKEDFSKLANIAENANNYVHPNHTGDVTSLGDGALMLADDVVGNTQLANVPTATLKGRTLAGTGDPQDLTAEQVRTLLNVSEGANAYVHPTTHTPSIIAQDVNNRFVSDAEKLAWDNKQAALGFTPENVVNKNVANGYAGLDANGKLNESQIPSIAITDTFEAASDAAMIELTTAQKGDICIRSDENKSYILTSNNYGVLADWKVLKTPTDTVLSVAGKTGTVTLVKGDVGLANVDNTTDLNKPISTATQTALNGKVNTTRTINNKALSADVVLTTADIADSADKRYVLDSHLTLLGNTSGTNSGDETASSIGSMINLATVKTTPVDTDSFGIMDSAAGNILKKLTWASIKATLKTYFDTLYNNYVHPVNHSPSIITQDSSNRFVTDAEKLAWNNKESAVNKNVANGYAGLDANGYFQGNSASANSILAPDYVAGEALTSDDLIFLAEDNKWYKALDIGTAIPTGAIFARCHTTVAAAAIVTAYIVGAGALPTSVVGIEGKDLYVRGELVDGVFVSAGTVSSQLDPGYSYIRFGSCILNTTTCHYDGNNQIYTIDDNANIVALDDTIIGNSGLVQIKKYSTTLADGATVINLPWLYNPLTKNVMVFLGQVYQDDSTLEFTDTNTITLTAPVVGSTPVTVIATFSLDQTHTISRHNGTLLAGTKTINLPWAYDINDQNVLVFLGSTYQHVDSLNYINNTTIELGDVVDEDTPYEVIRTMSLDNKTEMGGKYNYIINGNFDIWQRATYQSTHGYGSDDRWGNWNVGTTKVHSRQVFAVGETFPDGTLCPRFYSRTVVTSVTDAGNYCHKHQKIEFVRTLAGKKAVLSFYAKANANKTIAFDLVQSFGSEGTPSAPTSTNKQKILLTSTWKRYVIVLDVPSILGKTLGNTGDDCLWIRFWFDAGTSFNTDTDSLGHQSGTFDIASVSLIEGDKDINPIYRSYDEEVELCYRYFVVAGNAVVGQGEAVNTSRIITPSATFPVPMRAIPVVTIKSYGNKTTGAVNVYNNTGVDVGSEFAPLTITNFGILRGIEGSASLTIGTIYSFSVEADSEL